MNLNLLYLVRNVGSRRLLVSERVTVIDSILNESYVGLLRIGEL